MRTAFRCLEGGARIALALLLAALVSAATARAQTPCCSGDRCGATFTGNKVALVVGIDSYAKGRTGVEPLKNAVSDARVISDILREQEFSVICIEDATRPQVILALQAMGDHLLERETQAGPGDGLVSIVFFAGHGFATQEGDFLLLAPGPCPAEGDCRPPRREEMALPVDDLDAIVALGGSSSSKRVVIVDACRSPIDDGVRRLVGEDVGHFGRYGKAPSSDRAIFFRSTQEGVAAVDRDAALGADGNGLFVSRLRHILAFDRISMDDVGFTTIAAFAVLADKAVRQRPMSPYGPVFRTDHELRAKSQGSHRCNAAFDRSLTRFTHCWEPSGRCAPMFCELVSNVCPDGECMSQEDASCLRPLLTAFRPDHESFCQRIDKRVHAGPVRFSKPMALDAASLAQLRSFAQESRQTVLQNQRLDVIANADIRELNAARERDGLLRRIDRDRLVTRAPVDIRLAAGQTLRLRNLPNPGAPTIRILTGNDQLFADCFSQPCPEGWMGVRLHEGGEVFRGWVPFQDAAGLASVNTADEVFTFSFIDGTSRADERELQRLIDRLKDTGDAPRLAAGIVVTQPGETRDDRSYADARVARLRATLEQGGVPFQNIAPAIEVVPASTRPSGMVRLSKR